MTNKCPLLFMIAKVWETIFLYKIVEKISTTTTKAWETRVCKNATCHTKLKGKYYHWDNKMIPTHNHHSWEVHIPQCPQGMLPSTALTANIPTNPAWTWKNNTTPWGTYDREHCLSFILNLWSSLLLLRDILSSKQALSQDRFKRGKKLTMLPGSSTSVSTTVGLAREDTRLFDVDAMLCPGCGIQAPCLVLPGLWILALLFPRIAVCLLRSQKPHEKLFWKEGGPCYVVDLYFFFFFFFFFSLSLSEEDDKHFQTHYTEGTHILQIPQEK